MTTEPNKLEAMADHELAVAGRYRWWAVYLVREKRRLQGIADAVQAEAAAAATGLRLTGGLPPVEPVLPDGVETPDALLTRLDAGLALEQAAAAQLDDAPLLEGDLHEETVAAGRGDAAPAEQTVAQTAPAQPDDDQALRRKLGGRAALLGQQAAADEED